MSDSNKSRQVAEMGLHLSIVFEFLGVLAFAGLVGYALQYWVWPEQGAFVFLFAMMSGLGIGIYHIIQRTKSIEKTRVVPPLIQPKRPTVQDSHRALEDLREITRRLDKLKRRKR